MAGNHRRSRCADRDRDRARRQALPAALRATACRQSRAARRRRRAAADRAPSRHRLTRSKMSCHAAVAALIAIADQLLSKSNCRRWVKVNELRKTKMADRIIAACDGTVLGKKIA